MASFDTCFRCDLCHRWDLDDGGPVDVLDLGFGVLIVPRGEGRGMLGDLLGRDEHAEFVRSLAGDDELATTNLYYARLCRSVVAARGGKLTGIWPADRRRALGRALLELPRTVEIVPMSALAFRMAEIADDHGLSTLGAEAVAAAERSAAMLCIWSGDDGPRIRAAALDLRLSYRAITR